MALLNDVDYRVQQEGLQAAVQIKAPPPHKLSETLIRTSRQSVTDTGSISVSFIDQDQTEALPQLRLTEHLLRLTNSSGLCGQNWACKQNQPEDPFTCLQCETTHSHTHNPDDVTPPTARCLHNKHNRPAVPESDVNSTGLLGSSHRACPQVKRFLHLPAHCRVKLHSKICHFKAQRRF